MNWIVTSALMVIGSVLLYLTVRKSSILKFPTQFNNLAMFLIPLISYLLIGLSTGISYSIPVNYLAIFALVAFFLMYLPNVTSLKSIELAPNPGYSLVISKSYVVFTTLISYLFLNGEISTQKVFAILLIIIFSGLITIDPKKTKQSSSKFWVPYTLYSFFGWGLLSLSIKYFALQGMSTLTTLTYLYSFVSTFIVLEIIFRKIQYEVNYVTLRYFLLIGIFSSIFNYYNFYSVSIAPNVGYVNAINAASISIVTIFSIVLFKDDFSRRKMLGVFGVTGGLLLLLI